jgi:hypothetical protein
MYIQLIHTEKSRYRNEKILVQNFNNILTSRQEINKHPCLPSITKYIENGAAVSQSCMSELVYATAKCLKAAAD